MYQKRLHFGALMQNISSLSLDISMLMNLYFKTLLSIPQ